MNKDFVINQIIAKLKTEFAQESTGHDWFHIERVWKNAMSIAKIEGGDIFVIQLGALLHDIADHKFVENSEALGSTRTTEILANLNVAEDIINAVKHIVLNCSFKGGINANKMKSKEGLIVQDADRLDAIGAIGIARTFAYGGKAGNLIYHPEIGPTDFKTEDEYRNKRTHTVNHFYEKLLKLKDGMNTTTGKELANQRHQYMEDFLNQFYAEWEGKR